ncbi:MAG: hypothetical protein ABI686_02745 [Acidobacteriota bacterium]
MQTIYQINADELDENFLDSVKAQFKHKEFKLSSLNATKPSI